MVAAGFNQRSLALAAGLSETYCRDLFIGKSKNPKSDQLAAIAQVLNCTVEQLTNPGAVVAQAPDNVVDLSGVGKLRGVEPLLIRMWRMLGTDARTAVLNHISSLIDTAAPRKQRNI